jgi:hypothetical protein
MPNKYDYLAQGIMQAGQAIGQGLATRSQKELQKAKQLYTIAKNNIELGLDLLKETTDRGAREKIINKFLTPNFPIINPNVPIGTLSLTDDESADAINSYLKNAKSKGNKWAADNWLVLMQTLQETSVDPEKAIKGARAALDPTLPTGGLQTIGQGIEQQQTFFGGFGQQIPPLPAAQPQAEVSQPTTPQATPQPPTPQPAQGIPIINKELRNFISQRSDKFNTSDVVKEDIKLVGKLDTIKELAVKNPTGAIGTVKKMVARLTDVGRLSDFDVQFTDIDQSLKQEFMALVNKKGKGILSKEATKNISVLVDIIQGAVRRNLQAGVESSVAGIRSFAEGIPDDELRRMIAGPSYNQIYAVGKQPEPQQIDFSAMTREELEKTDIDALTSVDQVNAWMRAMEALNAR